MQLIINRKCPTLNHLYYHRGNMKILSTEARKLRDYISKVIPTQFTKSDIEYIKNYPLELNVRMHENWLTKKGEIKKIDIANREKFLVDSIFKCLGIDDKFIVHLMLRKVQNLKEEKVIVEIQRAIWTI